MKKVYKVLFVVVLLAACAKQTVPAMVPAIAVQKPSSNYVLGTIGVVEPVYFPPMKSPFYARIDTGAEFSSIDAENIKSFERDGDSWVSFVLKNRETGEKKIFEKLLVRKSSIRRIEESEERYVIMMEVRIKNQLFSKQFSLADRTKFNFQALIGRNVLTGKALIDPSLSNTLQEVE